MCVDLPKHKRVNPSGVTQTNDACLRQFPPVPLSSNITAMFEAKLTQAAVLKKLLDGVSLVDVGRTTKLVNLTVLALCLYDALNDSCQGTRIVRVTKLAKTYRFDRKDLVTDANFECNEEGLVRFHHNSRLNFHACDALLHYELS